MSETDQARRMMLYDVNRKSVGVAFLLWAFFGYVGGHRFYMGRSTSAVLMLVIMVLSALLTLILIGWIGIAIVAIWLLVDAFRIPGWVRDHNTKVMQSIG